MSMTTDEFGNALDLSPTSPRATWVLYTREDGKTVGHFASLADALAWESLAPSFYGVDQHIPGDDDGPVQPDGSAELARSITGNNDLSVASVPADYFDGQHGTGCRVISSRAVEAWTTGYMAVPR